MGGTTTFVRQVHLHDNLGLDLSLENVSINTSSTGDDGFYGNTNIGNLSFSDVTAYSSVGSGIFLTSHTGCWELLGAYLAAEGIPLDVVARRMYDERLERLLTDSRKSAGMGNISRGSGTRDIIRSLNAGRGIGWG